MKAGRRDWDAILPYVTPIVRRELKTWSFSQRSSLWASFWAFPVFKTCFWEVSPNHLGDPQAIAILDKSSLSDSLPLGPVWKELMEGLPDFVAKRSISLSWNIGLRDRYLIWWTFGDCWGIFWGWRLTGDLCSFPWSCFSWRAQSFLFL